MYHCRPQGKLGVSFGWNEKRERNHRWALRAQLCLWGPAGLGGKGRQRSAKVGKGRQRSSKVVEGRGRSGSVPLLPPPLLRSDIGSATLLLHSPLPTPPNSSQCLPMPPNASQCLPMPPSPAPTLQSWALRPSGGST